ncbi:Bug family tripartite tricarboxylate transporter substrate binding protein [Pigmentiphaga litoralis]|uniref:Bug family tripartite tricarboxylate transporter substrate binding protein n=1 Tax=Pigmentiphaga litoralis TaxID=516702 RepID=UPI003899E51F
MKKIKTRQSLLGRVLHGWLFAMTWSVALTSASTLAAEAYPTRPIRIVVGFAPGGTTDSVARVLSGALQQRLGQPVLIENRPGGSTQIAGEAVMRAAPDGYTLQMAASDLTILPSTRKRPPWDALKDFTPIARVATTGLVYTVSDRMSARTLRQFVEYAKAHPGQVSYGSSGTGGILHLVGEQLRSRVSVDLLHVPYKGGSQIVQDLLGAQIDMGVLGPIDVASRQDKLHPIAQTGPTRHPLLPNVPTTAEAGFPEVKGISMFTLIGPKGLPGAIVDRLASEITAIMQDPAFRERLLAAGAEPSLLTGPALTSFLAEDLRNWQEVAKASNILIDE